MPSLIPELVDAPGTHVLIIGVSRYRHLPGGEEPTETAANLNMLQLSGAARSASEFAAWMMKEYRNPIAPLSSLRVLLSPAPTEQVNQSVADLMKETTTATAANVRRELREFRAACNHHRNNVAVVYVAGHGVQFSKNGATVLLHDCGSDAFNNILDGAIDMASVHEGFNHSDTAQTQFWFVDACRQKVAVADQLWDMQAGIRLDSPVGFAQSNSMFLASVTGAPAFGHKGGPTLFNEVLMSGLRGGIACSPSGGAMKYWSVTNLELARQLPTRLAQLAAVYGVEQTVDFAGRVTEAAFHLYETPPSADLSVSLKPVERAKGCVGSLHNGRSEAIVKEVKSWPLKQRVEAGIYLVRVDTPKHAYDRQELIGVVPPELSHTVDLSS